MSRTAKPDTYRAVYHLAGGEEWTLVEVLDYRAASKLSREYRKAIAGVGHVAVLSHGYRLRTTSVYFVNLSTGLVGLSLPAR
jgi:hypothetical protein